MTELMRRRRALMAMKSSSGGHGLPSEYQEVEWIQSDGNQRIAITDDQSITDINKFIFEADVSVHETNSSTAIFMCLGSTAGLWLRVVSSGTKIGVGSSAYFSVDISERHTYKLDSSRSENTSYATCDGVSEIPRAKTNIASKRLTLFAALDISNWTYYSKVRMYSAKAWFNGALIRELYPCYRKSDNVIGMYDIVNDVFYTNSGSGTFTKGGNV